MKRYDAIKKIVESLNDELIVCNLGAPSRELYNIQDREENFYMLGSMGLVSSISFGLAISKPNKKVICIDGDGSLLMNLGSLSSGDQKTYTSHKTNLDVIAKGAGFESIIVIKEIENIVPNLKNLRVGCYFVLIKVDPGNAQVENVPLQPEELKERFMKVISKG